MRRCTKARRRRAFPCLSKDQAINARRQSFLHLPPMSTNVVPSYATATKGAGFYALSRLSRDPTCIYLLILLR